MSIQIKLRRDAAADWTSADPVLAEGECGYETDTGKFKIGDGTSSWTELDYAAVLPADAGTLAALDSPCPVANGGTGATTLGGAGLPAVVASWSCKAVPGAPALTDEVLLASAPAGRYRGSVAWESELDGEDSEVVTTAFGYHSADGASDFGVIPLFRTYNDTSIVTSPALSLDGYSSDGGSAIFHHDGTGDITFTIANSGTDLVNVYIQLERLPDAPGTAALYYLSAIADTAVDAGATVTLDPTGPTFAAGTEVEMEAVPSSGYHFVAWTGDDTSGTNPLTVSMTAAKSYGATFAADE